MASPRRTHSAVQTTGKKKWSASSLTPISILLPNALSSTAMPNDQDSFARTTPSATNNTDTTAVVQEFTDPALLSNTYNDSDSDDGSFELLSLSSLIPIIVVVSSVVVVAIGGNLLIIVSYLRDRRLRTVSNVYLVNLALSDLVLASISIPSNLVSAAFSLAWPLGTMICKVCLVIDYTLCVMSAFLVILISYDHLLILKKGARYATEETRLKAYVKIGFAWAFAFLINGPAIVSEDSLTDHSLNLNRCDVDFYKKETFAIVALILEFIVPAVTLLVLNASVYWEIRKRSKINLSVSYNISKAQQNGKLKKEKPLRMINTGRAKPSNSPCSVVADFRITSLSGEAFHSSPDETITKQTKINNGHDEQTIPAREPSRTSLEYRTQLPLGLKSVFSIDQFELKVKVTGITYGQDQGMESDCTVNNETRQSEHTGGSEHKQSKILPGKMTRRGKSSNPSTSQNAISTIIQATDPKRLRHIKRKDAKAFRALFLFGFVFVLMWTPFVIITVITAFCNHCVDQSLNEVFILLLLFKSAVNPFLYAANNSRIKLNCVRILRKTCFCC